MQLLFGFLRTDVRLVKMLGSWRDTSQWAKACCWFVGSYIINLKNFSSALEQFILDSPDCYLNLGACS